MGFCRQEYWSGLPFPSPGDLPDPGIKPRSPALQADSLPTELWGKPLYQYKYKITLIFFQTADFTPLPKVWLERLPPHPSVWSLRPPPHTHTHCTFPGKNLPTALLRCSDPVQGEQCWSSGCILPLCLCLCCCPCLWKCHSWPFPLVKFYPVNQIYRLNWCSNRRGGGRRDGEGLKELPASPCSVYPFPKAEESGSGPGQGQGRVVIKNRVQDWGNLELILFLV